MKSIVKIIELHTENFGSFTFTKHFNAPNVNPYEAMVCFESNNWERLGRTYYVVTLLWEDDTNTTMKVDGINAPAHLAEFMENAQF
jgi:hypothetical protein